MTQVGAGRDAYTVEQLIHQPTGYWFRFDINAARGPLWAIYEPGPEGARRSDHVRNLGVGLRIRAAVVGWVKQEYDAPDLWAELQRGRERLGPAPAEVENTPFTPQEQFEIGRQLREIKEYMRQTYQLDAAQYSAIDARLDYFAERQAVLAASTGGTLLWVRL